MRTNLPNVYVQFTNFSLIVRDVKEPGDAYAKLLAACATAGVELAPNTEFSGYRVVSHQPNGDELIESQSHLEDVLPRTTNDLATVALVLFRERGKPAPTVEERNTLIAKLQEVYPEAILQPQGPDGLVIQVPGNVATLGDLKYGLERVMTDLEVHGTLVRARYEMQMWCHDPRHAVPCKQPNSDCEDECGSEYLKPYEEKPVPFSELPAALQDEFVRALDAAGAEPAK